jgi:hypothetical protein
MLHQRLNSVKKLHLQYKVIKALVLSGEVGIARMRNGAVAVSSFRQLHPGSVVLVVLTVLTVLAVLAVLHRFQTYLVQNLTIQTKVPAVLRRPGGRRVSSSRPNLTGWTLPRTKEVMAQTLLQTLPQTVLRTLP